MARRKRTADSRTPPKSSAVADLARRARQVRDATGLTQEAVARRARLTAKFVSQIENGHVNPSIEVVTRLVEDGLSLPLSAFFAAEGGDVKGDIDQLVALFGGQPAATRRLALRVLRALCADAL